MNTAAMLNHAALAAVLTTVAVTAQARGGGVLPPRQPISHSFSVASSVPEDSNAQTDAARPTGQPVADVSPAQGKTRAQVRAEIVRAGEDGMLPSRWVDYPPSAATRTRNRENFLRLEQAWKAEGIIAETSVGGINGLSEEKQ
ncbi:TPA: DUF4148 domain-containing protein [Burkholderia aenigmatica]|uniref:DUF4148 domain-containing protein n=1 Tax=Burkholderia sp. AU45251 TaxID=3059204 RepID=UPI00264AB3FA|nr:DUF4148 domain-containing protein [Burkholderia sp. AU45251]HDR9482569.1 DUF4148 domain-containing protein [Burkholderia aenigmatica]MDN7517729.1 DUF4148 domain-containing protein [Burkholderia sp. AU45251]HDR9513516.1 DUF4148 domain-containing protein [Burkholderia aenigmatica]HDR9590907.1 DUF4148 domain-containing protein [Burkholderia aenigmatica]HDR9601695.1 DUF4148 domain-containing protein [Burkholderia aenigmatica]